MYMFNLIVGTGALTMPRAFAAAGWVVSLALISLLGFMRYVLVYLKTENGCSVHRKCLNLFFMFSLVCLSKCPCLYEVEMVSADICADLTL